MLKTWGNSLFSLLSHQVFSLKALIAKVNLSLISGIAATQVNI